MTIIHDAYLLNPEMFASKIAPYLEVLQTHKGYGQLRSDAIRLYDNSSDLRALLGDYGGWDKHSILTQIPETLPYDQEDVAFWLVILLYSEFKSRLHQLGLGSDLNLAQHTLTQLGWLDDEVELLVKGKSFKDFVQAWLHREADIPDYWNYIRPSSTSAWAGWLDRTEVEHLLSKLNEDEQKLLRLTEEIPETDSIAVKRTYRSVMDMLVSANQNNSGLCLIISG